MSRDDAISTLRQGLARLPFGHPRAAAFSALDRLVFAVHVEAAEALVREAYHVLLMEVPELKRSADKLLADWTESSQEPKL